MLSRLAHQSPYLSCLEARLSSLMVQTGIAIVRMRPCDEISILSPDYMQDENKLKIKPHQ